MSRFTAWVARATTVATFGAMVGLIGGATATSANELEPSALVTEAAPVAECKNVWIKVTVRRGDLPADLLAAMWVEKPPEELTFTGYMTLAIDDSGKFSGAAQQFKKDPGFPNLTDASKDSGRAIYITQSDAPSFTLAASKGQPDEFDKLFKDCKAKVSGSASSRIVVKEMIPTPQALTPYKQGKSWTIEYSGTWVANS